MRYSVKLYTLPARTAWVRGKHPTAEQAPGFTVDARIVDAAMQQARDRIVERGLRLRSINAAPGNVLIAYAEESQ